MSEIVIIVAIADNGAIGRQGDLLAHVPGDLKRFKALTMGHPIIMGRRTFESLPKGALPGRTNIVISHAAPAKRQGAQWATSLHEALIMAEDAAGGETVFVLGGGQIYEQAYALADRLEVTRLHIAPDDADTFFPAIEADEWQMEGEPQAETDPRVPFPYEYQTFTRKRDTADIDYENIKWVVLNLYPNAAEAYIAKGALDANHVPCVLENQTLAGVFALPNARFSEVKLLVPDVFAAQARQILGLDKQ